MIHNPAYNCLLNKTGHSKNEIKLIPNVIKRPLLAGKVKRTIGIKYKIHCGLQPGDQSKNNIQVNPMKAKRLCLFTLFIFVIKNNPNPRKIINVNHEGIFAGFPNSCCIEFESRRFNNGMNAPVV